MPPLIRSCLGILHLSGEVKALEPLHHTFWVLWLRLQPVFLAEPTPSPFPFVYVPAKLGGALTLSLLSVSQDSAPVNSACSVLPTGLAERASSIHAAFLICPGGSIVSFWILQLSAYYLGKVGGGGRLLPTLHYGFRVPTTSPLMWGSLHPLPQHSGGSSRLCPLLGPVPDLSGT